jgi:uncharacterized protein YaaQ
VKLMIVILTEPDVDSIVAQLLDREFRVTKIATTGGFLRRGNTTLLIGTEDDLVEDALETLRDTCKDPDEPGLKRATVFVLGVERYTQL